MKIRHLALLLAAVAACCAWAFHERRPRAESAILYGNVDIREVQLGFRVGGRIDDVRLDEGDAVKAGDILAILDEAPLRHEVDQAKAQVCVREAELGNARLEMERAEKLLKNAANSRQAYDDAAATLARTQAQLDLARAQLSSAETRLADTRLLAPSDGIVITRAREPGAVVQAGDTVLIVSLEHPVWVRAYIEENHLGWAYPGREVTLTSDTHPERVYHGKIGFVSPRAEFTPKAVETPELRTSLVYRLRVVVEDADQSLRQGMPVTVRISS